MSNIQQSAKRQDYSKIIVFIGVACFHLAGLAAVFTTAPAPVLSAGGTGQTLYSFNVNASLGTTFESPLTPNDLMPNEATSEPENRDVISEDANAVITESVPEPKSTETDFIIASETSTNAHTVLAAENDPPPELVIESEPKIEPKIELEKVVKKVAKKSVEKIEKNIETTVNSQPKKMQKIKQADASKKQSESNSNQSRPAIASSSQAAGSESGGQTGSNAVQGILSSKELQYIRKPTPTYPIAARKSREQGTVIILAQVNELGVPINVSVSRTSGFLRLDDAALKAARAARFKPYLHQGNPIKVRVSIPIGFALTD